MDANPQNWSRGGAQSNQGLQSEEEHDGNGNSDQVTIGVGALQERQFEELEVTVDTGSTFTAVPREMLQRLGVRVERSMPSVTADGRIVPVDVAHTTVRLEGLEFPTPVIFAEPGEPSLLGVVTLEEAGLAVDPVGGQLVPTHLLRY